MTSNAKWSLRGGVRTPYHRLLVDDDRRYRPKSRAEVAALGVLYNLSDRAGIDNALEDVEQEDREEIVATLTTIIAEAFARGGARKRFHNSARKRKGKQR